MADLILYNTFKTIGYNRAKIVCDNELLYVLRQHFSYKDSYTKEHDFYISDLGTFSDIIPIIPSVYLLVPAIT